MKTIKQACKDLKKNGYTIISHTDSIIYCAANLSHVSGFPEYVQGRVLYQSTTPDLDVICVWKAFL